MTRTDAPVSPSAIAALSFAAFASAASTRVADPLLPRLDVEFGIGLGSAAQTVTAFSIAYGVTQVVYGAVGDRYGKYRVVAWACAASALTALGCALAPSFGALVIARFIAGATAAAVIPLSMAWIGDVIPYERRQSVLARFLIGHIFGFAGGQLAGGLAAEYWSWRVPFVGLSLWYAIAAATLWRMHRRVPEPLVVSPATGKLVVHHLLADMRYVLRQRWARIVLISVFLESAAMFGPVAFLPAHLNVIYGISLAAAGGSLILYGVGGLAFVMVAPLSVRRLGEVGLSVGGGIVLCIALLLAGLGSSWPVALFACFLAGLGFYMLHSTLQTNATQMAPHRRGAALAVFASCVFLGQAAGVAIAGVCVEHTSTTPIIVVGAFALLAIGIVFGRLRATHEAPAGE